MSRPKESVSIALLTLPFLVHHPAGLASDLASQTKAEGIEDEGAAEVNSVAKIVAGAIRDSAVREAKQAEEEVARLEEYLEEVKAAPQGQLDGIVRQAELSARFVARHSESSQRDEPYANLYVEEIAAAHERAKEAADRAPFLLEQIKQIARGELAKRPMELLAEQAEEAADRAEGLAAAAQTAAKRAESDASAAELAERAADAADTAWQETWAAEQLAISELRATDAEHLEQDSAILARVKAARRRAAQARRKARQAVKTTQR